jgi:CBS domain-containing protein
MLLSELCQLDVACCRLQTSILEAAQLMRHKHVGDLVVVGNDPDDRAPIGIITDRDIIVEVLATGLDPAKTRVGDVIRRPVAIAHQDEDASQALEQMRTHGIRRIPVVDRAGRLTGIITADDMLKWLAVQAARLVQSVAEEQTHEYRLRR